MSKKKKGPSIPDIATLIKAGINPYTRNPLKFEDIVAGNDLQSSLLKAFRIMDEQDAVNRYVWSGLPCNITSQELERMLYYRGQLCFFYYEDLDEFYFMPYSLSGTIDFYGRYNTIKPLPFTQGTEIKDESAKKVYDMQSGLLSTMLLRCRYGVMDEEDIDEEVFTKSAVLLHDYTKQLSQEIIPRQQIQDSICRFESELPCFMRTALIAGCGVKGYRVNDADQEESVNEASNDIVYKALTGKVYTAISGSIDLQDLASGQGHTQSQEYLLAVQAVDNLRKSAYGIENGGLYEKSAHINESEFNVNMSGSMNQLQDGLSIRQNFCNIVNSIWGLGIWCEPSENVVMVDMDGDGMIQDENADAQNSGVEEEGGEDE